MSDLQARLINSGWSLVCERFANIEPSPDAAGPKRSCTWTATKGIERVVVQGELGQEQIALRYLYDMIKSRDPDLQQVALEAGSGGWVFDLSDVESHHHDGH